MKNKNFLAEFMSMGSNFGEMDSDALMHCKELAIAALSNGEAITDETLELIVALDEELLNRGM